ncbi:MAG: DUF4446 family protein [Lachnospiraceae bacterium]|nr:DUF4446 family protein [Lachnospiraceae bacterium]
MKILATDVLMVPGTIILLVFCIVLLILLLMQNKKMADVDKRLRRLMRGKTASSLESEIIHLFEANDVLTENAHDLQRRMDTQEQIIETCFRKSGLVKYDAFNQMGGKLSFALALLKEDNNGIILNSVHSPEGNYTYVKEVKEGRCDLELSSEEEKALNSALSTR